MILNLKRLTNSLRQVTQKLSYNDEFILGD